jgi:hypothetical protein
MPDNHHSSASVAGCAASVPPPQRPSCATPPGTASPCTASPSTASPWLQRWIGLVHKGARMIDVAAGRGRNVGPLLARGARVLAVDRDADALAEIDPRAECRLLDLENGPWCLPAASFDGVVVCNYLFRPRLALLAGMLAPGGLLLYETFAHGNARFGRPSNPDFLLRPGELLALAARAGLHVLGYEDGVVEEPRAACVQRICAARPPLPAQGFRLPRVDS